MKNTRRFTCFPSLCFTYRIKQDQSTRATLDYQMQSLTFKCNSFHLLKIPIDKNTQSFEKRSFRATINHANPLSLNAMQGRGMCFFAVRCLTKPPVLAGDGSRLKKKTQPWEPSFVGLQAMGLEGFKIRKL